MSNNMSGQVFSQAPATDDYDWDSDGGLKRGSTGVSILRANCDAVVKKPSWFGKETVFRPYPYLSDGRDANSPFEPYRIIDSGGRNKFSNWIRRYICAWNVGNPTTTFLIKRPQGAQVFDPASTPLGILFRSINNAVKKGQAHPEWPPLLMKVSGKSPTLEGPKECYVIQGALFRHDGKDYFGQYGDPLGFGKNQPLVLLTSGGAGSDLVQKLGEEHDIYHGDPMDFEARYKMGDPVSCTSGRFIHFFEKGRNPYQNRYASQPQGGNPMGDDGGWGAPTQGNQKRTKEIGFDVYISPDFEGLPAKFNTVAERTVRSKVRSWDDLLYFPTEIEQAHMLFRCFPLSACMYAFEGVNKDWIPEDAYKKMANAVSAPVTGYPAAPGFNQTPQQHPGFVGQQPPQVNSWSQPQQASRRHADGPSWGPPPAPPTSKGPTQDTTVPMGDIDAVNNALGYPPNEDTEPEAPVPETPLSKVEAPKSSAKVQEAMARLSKNKKS